MMARRDVRLLLIAALIALCWLTSRELAGAGSGLLYLTPLLSLLAPLLLQRYPGERSIIALAAKLRRPRRRRVSLAGVKTRATVLRAGAGGSEVLAFELAGRAPPLLS